MKLPPLSNTSLLGVLLGVRSRQDISNSLVRALEILLCAHVVANLEKNDWGSDELLSKASV